MFFNFFPAIRQKIYILEARSGSALLREQKQQNRKIFSFLFSAPQPPFRGAILELTGALVVPERDHDTKLASGVLRADGSHVELSRKVMQL